MSKMTTTIVTQTHAFPSEVHMSLANHFYTYHERAKWEITKYDYDKGRIHFSASPYMCSIAHAFVDGWRAFNDSMAH